MLQKSHLRTWLDNHNIKAVPIECLIVMTNPYTILRASPTYKEVLHKVIHKELLIQKITEITQSYSDDRFLQKEMKKIAKLLSKHHQPHVPNIMEQFNIDVSDIMTGTHCPNCFAIPMTYQKGKWYCSKCNFLSKHAHISSLMDYSLLLRTKNCVIFFIFLPVHLLPIYFQR